MFRGTPEISAGGLDDIVARLGAQMNGETNYDYTQFYFEMPVGQDSTSRSSSTPIACSTLRCAPPIGRSSATRCSTKSTATPARRSSIFWRASAPRPFPISRPDARRWASREDVARATVADIARYYREWYAPNNATLVVAGDVEPRGGLCQGRSATSARSRRRSCPPGAEHRSGCRLARRRSKRSFRFRSKSSTSPTRFPATPQHGEPAISTLATLLENQRSPFYRALVQSNIALGIEANADTQLRGGLLHVFIILNPGHNGREAQVRLSSDARLGAAERLRPRPRPRGKTDDDRRTPLLGADSIDGIGDLAGYTYGIVARAASPTKTSGSRRSPAPISSPRRVRICSRPTVVGHLTPQREPAARQLAEEQRRSKRRFLQTHSQRPDRRAGLDRESGPRRRRPRAARSRRSSSRSPTDLRVIVQTEDRSPDVRFARQDRSRRRRSQPPGKEGIARLASSAADYGSANYPFAQRRKATDEMGAFVDDRCRVSRRKAEVARLRTRSSRSSPTAKRIRRFADPWFAHRAVAARQQPSIGSATSPAS